MKTFFGVAWHILTALGIVALVVLLWVAVTFPRALLLLLGGWVVYRVTRLVVFAFKHDARRFTP